MVSLPNPSFEPKTHRWHPGAGAPCREVPAQNCAFCAPKQPFLARNGPKTHSDRQTKANGCYTSRAPQLPRDQTPFVALHLHEMSEKRPKNGQKWPECARFVSNRPETKNGTYLRPCGSYPNSEGTYSTRNAPLFVVSKPRNRPTRQLDPRTSGHLVRPEAQPAHGWGQRRVHRGPPGEKKDFFQSCS